MADIQDPVEGVTTRTTKDEMLGRLRQASKDLLTLKSKLSKQETTRLDRLQEIEQRVQKKYASRPTTTVQNVIVSGTVEELTDTAEFLDEFGREILPVMLQRLSIGLDALLKRDASEDDQ